MAISRIMVLVENTARGRDLLGEHGLAFWVEAGSRRILFDTGQGMVLQKNATEMGVSLDDVDTIVLSHGHYDHTGGLVDLLQNSFWAKVYTHRNAFLPKYMRKNDGTIHDVGTPSIVEEWARCKADELIWIDQPTEIGEGLFVTGQIPRLNDYEDTGGQFFADEKCEQPDLLLDDQALYFESVHGIVVLLGCAHAGIINTLNYIHELTEGKPIYAVIGGMHLGNASRDRMNATIDALGQLKIEHLYPAHCTGMAATMELCKIFPGKCFPCIVGTTIEFEVL